MSKRSAILLALASFSRRQKWGAAFLALLIVGACLLIIGEVNRRFTVKVSAVGGQIQEGIIGTPRFINPLLASSDADRDLSTLIYSGLMRIGTDGQPQPDLAASYQVSANNLSHTFILKAGLTWQDGTPLTAADVAFTVQKIQDPLIKSPKRASWEGVKIRVIDDRTVVFDLSQPYPAFLEQTTLGILPKHLWEKFDVEAFTLNQFNTESIGSGPYQIKSIKKNNLGIPESYTLEPFKNFALGPAKIKRLVLRFYANQDALLSAYRRGEIDSLAAIPAEVAKQLEAGSRRLTTVPLPRVFGVFFNQNRAPVLANLEVRQALDLAVDKQAIIDQVLHGYGALATGPVPALNSPTQASSSDQQLKIEAARAKLESQGWTWQEDRLQWDKKGTILSLSLATADTPELKQVAELIKQAWEKLGVKVELKVFELGDLNQNVIRPRQYDALFFGEVLGRDPDLFSFWHSSQRLDPGLNIALYTSSKADQLLDQIRASTDLASRQAAYQKFHELLAAETPAIFLYSPYFLYLSPAAVKDLSLVPINTPADRFINVYRWYIKTDNVWRLFANKYNEI